MRVLVPVAVLKGESVPLGLMSLLGTADVTVLGYHVLPEQTTPDQARLQYADRANAALADVTQEFREAGGDAEYRLVFTHDREQTVRRVADEVRARAIAISGATGTVDHLLVSLTGDVAVESVLEFVTDLIGDRRIGVTLFRASDAEDDEVLAAAAERLDERGIDVRTERAPESAAFESLVEAAAGHDGVVVGEHAPSLRSMLFGESDRRLAAETVGPVLVVRREAAG